MNDTTDVSFVLRVANNALGVDCFVDSLTDSGSSLHLVAIVSDEDLWGARQIVDAIAEILSVSVGWLNVSLEAVAKTIADLLGMSLLLGLMNRSIAKVEVSFASALLRSSTIWVVAVLFGLASKSADGDESESSSELEHVDDE